MGAAECPSLKTERRLLDALNGDLDDRLAPGELLIEVADARNDACVHGDRPVSRVAGVPAVGVAGSCAPVETSVYSPGPEWRTYDPKQSNELLDKIGLTQKGADTPVADVPKRRTLRKRCLADIAGPIPLRYASIVTPQIRRHQTRRGARDCPNVPTLVAQPGP